MKSVKKTTVLMVLSLVYSLTVFSAGNPGRPFPVSPDYSLTPGSLCAQPTEYRYPEHIPYCERAVGSGLKEQVIRMYDERLGYQVERMNRSEFKIDHYVPLCMGGSNGATNLWPQHQTVYQYTDPLEQLACTKMAEGKLRQKDGVDIIRRAKADIQKAGQYFTYLQGL